MSNKNTKLVNDHGEYLAFDGQNYIGDMNVYDCYLIGEDGLNSYWNLTVDASSSFALSNVDDQCKFTYEINNQGYSIFVKKANSIELEKDKICIYGNSYEVDAFVSQLILR